MLDEAKLCTFGSTSYKVSEPHRYPYLHGLTRPKRYLRWWIIHPIIHPSAHPKTLIHPIQLVPSSIRGAVYPSVGCYCAALCGCPPSIARTQFGRFPPPLVIPRHCALAVWHNELAIYHIPAAFLLIFCDMPHVFVILTYYTMKF